MVESVAYVRICVRCWQRLPDLLGGEVYLERWAQFVKKNDAHLRAIGTEYGHLSAGWRGLLA